MAYFDESNIDPLTGRPKRQSAALPQGARLIASSRSNDPRLDSSAALQPNAARPIGPTQLGGKFDKATGYQDFAGVRLQVSNPDGSGLNNNPNIMKTSYGAVPLNKPIGQRMSADGSMRYLTNNELATAEANSSAARGVVPGYRRGVANGIDWAATHGYGTQPMKLDSSDTNAAIPSGKPDGIEWDYGYADGGPIRPSAKHPGRPVKRSGAVKGKGGPTDDKVSAKLPVGGYVLPADTVKAIGKKGVAALRKLAMGHNVDAQVSNGEEVFSPEEAKAIGIHNLDAIREATHTPVHMADGGLIEQGVNAIRNREQAIDAAVEESIKNPPAAGPAPTVPAESDLGIGDIRRKYGEPNVPTTAIPEFRKTAPTAVPQQPTAAPVVDNRPDASPAMRAGAPGGPVYKLVNGKVVKVPAYRHGGEVVGYADGGNVEDEYKTLTGAIPVSQVSNDPNQTTKTLFTAPNPNHAKPSLFDYGGAARGAGGNPNPDIAVPIPAGTRLLAQGYDIGRELMSQAAGGVQKFAHENRPLSTRERINMVEDRKAGRPFLDPRTIPPEQEPTQLVAPPNAIRSFIADANRTSRQAENRTLGAPDINAEGVRATPAEPAISVEQPKAIPQNNLTVTDAPIVRGVSAIRPNPFQQDVSDAQAKYGKDNTLAFGTGQGGVGMIASPNAEGISRVRSNMAVPGYFDDAYAHQIKYNTAQENMAVPGSEAYIAAQKAANTAGGGWADANGLRIFVPESEESKARNTEIRQANREQNIIDDLTNRVAQGDRGAAVALQLMNQRGANVAGQKKALYDAELGAKRLQTEKEIAQGNQLATMGAASLRNKDASPYTAIKGTNADGTEITQLRHKGTGEMLGIDQLPAYENLYGAVQDAMKMPKDKQKDAMEKMVDAFAKANGMTPDATAMWISKMIQANRAQ